MYGNNCNAINGYTYNHMMWYVLFSELIWFGVSTKILTDDICHDIKSGEIACNMNKPYNYIYFLISKYIAEIMIKCVPLSLFAICIGLIMIGPLEEFSGFYFIFVLITVLLAIFINGFINVSISCTSFWFEENQPFHWIYNKLILLLGVLFPMDALPSKLNTYIKYTPIFVTIYGPSKLFIDFSFDMLYKVILWQFIYLFICIIISQFVFKKGIKRINVNGG